MILWLCDRVKDVEADHWPRVFGWAVAHGTSRQGVWCTPGELLGCSMGWSGGAMQGKALSFGKYRGLKGLAAFPNVGLSAAPVTTE